MDVKNLTAAAVAKAEELCQTFDYDVAESFLRQALKVDPDNDEAWFLLGVVCACQEKNTDAAESFDMAANLTVVEENKQHAMWLKEKITQK